MQAVDLKKSFNDFLLKHGVGSLFDCENDNINYRVDFKGGLEHMRGLVQAVLNFADKQKKKPIVYINYIDSLEINAFAAKDEDNNVYYIGVNSGVVYLLQRIFNTMLASPNVLLGIGDAKNETIVSNVDINFYTSVQNFIENDISLSYPIPKDTARANYAHFLTLKALAFLSMHELTHIINGHVDYLTDKIGVRLMQEKQFTDEEKKYFLLSQTLEYDADAIGISNMVIHMMHIAKTPATISLAYRFIVEDVGRAVGTAAFAIYTIFKIFSNDAPAGDAITNEDHPPFDIRRRLIGPVISSMLFENMEKGKISKEQQAHITKEIIFYLVSAEAAFACIDPKGIAITAETGKNTYLDDSSLSYVQLLEKHWAVIRPELLPYAIGELVEPKTE